MSKKSAAKKDAQREQTLAEIVDTIETYFAVSPFDFILGANPEGSHRLFSRLDNKPPDLKTFGWNFKWMSALIPRVSHTLEKLEAQKEFSDETMDLCVDSQQFGSFVGILLGMKRKGATKEELMRSAEAFALTVFHYDPSLDHEEGKAK